MNEHIRRMKKENLSHDIIINKSSNFVLTGSCDLKYKGLDVISSPQNRSKNKPGRKNTSIWKLLALGLKAPGEMIALRTRD